MYAKSPLYLFEKAVFLGLVLLLCPANSVMAEGSLAVGSRLDSISELLSVRVTAPESLPWLLRPLRYRP